MFEPCDVPPKYRGMYNAATLHGDVLAAIRSMCAHCQGWVELGIDNCVSEGCPLWPWRMDYIAFPRATRRGRGEGATGTSHLR